jgi:hypothetical protein
MHVLRSRCVMVFFVRPTSLIYTDSETRFKWSVRPRYVVSDSFAILDLYCFFAPRTHIWRLTWDLGVFWHRSVVLWRWC